MFKSQFLGAEGEQYTQQARVTRGEVGRPRAAPGCPIIWLRVH